MFILPSPFPSVAADSRRLGETLRAERGGEGKAPAGSDATGLGSAGGNQPHADKMRSSSRPTQRMSLTLISIVFGAELIRRQPTDIICGLRFLSFPAFLFTLLFSFSLSYFLGFFPEGF